ncbi:MAG: hypothetical protein J2P18_02510 [Nocardia sp.]|nr:hypothetical protein [Nocardia sp.]
MEIDDHSGAVGRAVRYLGSGWDERGLPRALVSLSPRMSPVHPAGEGRRMVRDMFGRDIGFDLGDERFTASLALANLPESMWSVHPGLRDKLAQVVRSGHDEEHRYAFFFDDNGFPVDTDCTAMAVGALYDSGLISPDELLAAGRELLASAVVGRIAAGPHAADYMPGVVLVYWQDLPGAQGVSRAPRYDAVACANALYVLRRAMEHGLADPEGVVEATTAYVVDHLISGRYRDGTRYYSRPESFLYSFSRLCAAFPDIGARYAESVARELPRGESVARLSALDLALSIVAAGYLGDDGHQRARRASLVAMQDDRGAWPAGAYYRMGRVPLYWGSPTLTSIFAAKALAGD